MLMLVWFSPYWVGVISAAHSALLFTLHACSILPNLTQSAQGNVIAGSKFLRTAEMRSQSRGHRQILKKRYLFRDAISMRNVNHSAASCSEQQLYKISGDLGTCSNLKRIRSKKRPHHDQSTCQLHPWA